jgi:hypothetical protein
MYTHTVLPQVFVLYTYGPKTSFTHARTRIFSPINPGLKLYRCYCYLNKKNGPNFVTDYIVVGQKRKNTLHVLLFECNVSSHFAI